MVCSQKTALPLREEEAAEAFGEFFLHKLEDIRKCIPASTTLNPMAAVLNRMNEERPNFELRTVSESKVQICIKKLKQSKAVGPDGIPTQLIKLGSTEQSCLL